jgi:D-3-phosphoglycerate dehydrogenase
MTNNMLKVLISSRSFGKIDSGAMELLDRAGLKSDLNPYGRKLEENELIHLLDNAVGVIAGTEKITEKVLSNAEKLKVISRYGVGMDNVDLNTANQKGILVFNTPETPSIAVAELTLTLILNLLKKINKHDKKVKQNQWKPEIGNLLSEKTIGIIGLGRIGKKLVQMLKGFKVKIIAYDIKPDEKFIQNNNVETTTLDTLLQKSDIITLHLPITEETKNIIGEKQLQMIKPHAIIINTARGGLIDENTLYNMLKNKKIAGAAMDAFEQEPYTGKLKELDNVILTPHIGTFTVETRKNMEIEAANNLINGLKKVGIL